MPDAEEVLTVEHRGHVATVWLDNAPRRNAMGLKFFAQLPAIFEHLGADPDVRAVVVAAKGPDFGIGLDLKGMGGLLAQGAAPGTRGGSQASQRTSTYREIRRLQDAVGAPAGCAKPVVAAVHGWCIGGAVDLIACCDIRLASADARFSIRETKVAIVADLGTLQRLPAIIGQGNLAELAFTGKDITAEHAHRIGLVNDVLPDVDALHAAAQDLAAEIAANPPLVVQGVKQVLRACEGRTVDEGLDYVAVWNSAFLASDDLVEAMAAFIEKRPPKFSGS